VKGIAVSMLPAARVWAKAKVHALVVYGGSGSVAPPILTLALVGGKWSDSQPLYPEGKNIRPDGPRAHPDDWKKKKN
jgi:hypothetical protein